MGADRVGLDLEPVGVPPYRCFVAVFPPRELQEKLGGVRDRLKDRLSGLRWVPPHNLHYTLRFFGDLDRDQLRSAGASLAEVTAGVKPFELELDRLGVFPGWKRPRVLWVGAGRGGATLSALAREFERAFISRELGPSDKAFKPHLTLGRWREHRSLGETTDARSACELEKELGSFLVSEPALVQSVLEPGASPQYRRLGIFPCSAERGRA